MSTKKTTIGGQAIIEGIVMKGPKKTCTVVRKAGGELVTKTEDAHHPRRSGACPFCAARTHCSPR